MVYPFNDIEKESRRERLYEAIAGIQKHLQSGFIFRSGKEPEDLPTPTALTPLATLPSYLQNKDSRLNLPEIRNTMEVSKQQLKEAMLQQAGNEFPMSSATAGTASPDSRSATLRSSGGGGVVASADTLRTRTEYASQRAELLGSSEKRPPPLPERTQELETPTSEHEEDKFEISEESSSASELQDEPQKVSHTDETAARHSDEERKDIDSDN